MRLTFGCWWLAILFPYCRPADELVVAAVLLCSTFPRACLLRRRGEPLFRLLVFVDVDPQRLLLELKAALLEVDMKIFLHNVGRLHATYRARRVDHAIRAARALHIVLILQLAGAGLIKLALEAFRLRNRVALERLTLRALGLGDGGLRLLDLRKVNCNGRVRRLALTRVHRSSLRVHQAPIERLSVVDEWHLRAVRLALLHALARPRWLDLLLWRRRYVALAEDVRCVFGDVALQSALVDVKALVTSACLACLPLALVQGHAFYLLHLGVHRHLPHFLGLIYHFLFHYLLFLSNCKVVRLCSQCLDVVVVKLLVDGSAHVYFVVEVVFDINATFNTAPVRVPVLLDMVCTRIHVVYCKEIRPYAWVRSLNTLDGLIASIV